MKIEVKLKPEIFGILPHQMISQDQCSIIWEPLLNSFADWWCSMYVDREMYKQKSFTVLDSYKKLYNHWDSMDGHEELRKQTQKIRRIITEINEYIEDPKDYFPLNPWLGVFLICIGLSSQIYSEGKSLIKIQWPEKWLLLGKNTLIIYVFHQPFLIGIMLATGIISFDQILD